MMMAGLSMAAVSLPTPTAGADPAGPPGPAAPGPVPGAPPAPAAGVPPGFLGDEFDQKRVFRHHAAGFLWTIDGKAIEAKTHDRRMLFAAVTEWRLHADRILVIVINATLLRVTAARIQPDFRIAFNSVHAARFERIEEDNAVQSKADWSHGNTSNVIIQFRLQR